MKHKELNNKKLQFGSSSEHNNGEIYDNNNHSEKAEKREKKGKMSQDHL